MDYPDNFDTNAFPAGTRIAVSRTVALGIMIVFFLIICICGALLWCKKHSYIEPYLISINNKTGEWYLVKSADTDTQKTVTYYEAIQQSVIGKFTQYWFTISKNNDDNINRWEKCDRQKICNSIDRIYQSDRECSFYCLAGDTLFNKFTQDIVPLYKNSVSVGEQWTLDSTTLEITKYENTVTEQGGIWTIRAKVSSNINGVFDILGFVVVSQNMDAYSKSFGYYISEFNTYRITQ